MCVLCTECMHLCGNACAGLLPHCHRAHMPVLELTLPWYTHTEKPARALTLSLNSLCHWCSTDVGHTTRVPPGCRSARSTPYSSSTGTPPLLLPPWPGCGLPASPAAPPSSMFWPALLLMTPLTTAAAAAVAAASGEVGVAELREGGMVWGRGAGLVLGPAVLWEACTAAAAGARSAAC